MNHDAAVYRERISGCYQREHNITAVWSDMHKRHNLVLQVNIDSGRRGDSMFSFVPDLYDFASKAAMEYARKALLLIPSTFLDI